MAVGVRLRSSTINSAGTDHPPIHATPYTQGEPRRPRRASTKTPRHPSRRSPSADSVHVRHGNAHPSLSRTRSTVFTELELTTTFRRHR